MYREPYYTGYGPAPPSSKERGLTALNPQKLGEFREIQEDKSRDLSVPNEPVLTGSRSAMGLMIYLC